MSVDAVLSWAAAVLAGASVASAAALAQPWLRSSEPAMRYVAWLEVELRYQGARWTGAQLAMAQAHAAALLLGVAALASSWLPVVLALALIAGPGVALQRERLARTSRIERQLDGFLIALAHALRATPALGDGLRSSADVLAPPLADELRVLLHEHDLGTPLDRALDAMARRIASPVASAALGTLRISRGSGGDFVRTLEHSAAALREMARLEGIVRAKTAEGRAQTAVVSVLPVPLLLLIDHLSPSLLEPLWTTDAGHVLVAVAIALWLAAIVAARRISQVDI